MTQTRKIRIRLAALTVGAGALLIPVSFAPGQPDVIEPTDACADQTCCREPGSICDRDGKVNVNFYEAAACVRPD